MDQVSPQPPASPAAVLVPLAQPLPQPPALSPDGIAEIFLQRHNPSTSAAYRRDLAGFAAWTGASSPAEAVARFLAGGQAQACGLAIAYRGFLAERHAPKTVNRRMAALRAVVRFARQIGLVVWTLEVPDLRTVRYRDTRGPGIAGMRALLAVAAEQAAGKAARDTAILRLLFDLALRLHEVTTLDRTHLEPDRLWILGKGRGEREACAVPPATAAAIARWLDHRGEAAGALFTNLLRSGVRSRLTDRGVEHLVGWLSGRAGIRATPHGLRHAAITHALDLTGGDFRKVARFSRHADIRTVAVYDDNRQGLGGQVAAMVSGAV